MTQLSLLAPQRLRVLFCMLNPSTADHRVDDPTVRRCDGFAARLGATPDGGMGAEISECGRYRYLLWRPRFSIVNLWPYRTPNPDDLAKGQKAGIDIQ